MKSLDEHSININVPDSTNIITPHVIVYCGKLRVLFSVSTTTVNIAPSPARSRC